MNQGEAHIWFFSIKSNRERQEFFWDLLAADERAKADRFYFEKDRLRSIVSRGVLRKVLGRYLDAPAKDLVFSYGPHGKPHLPGPLSFNLSHSGDYAAIAVATNRSIGVDLELMRPDIGHEGIARRFFTERECAWLDSQSPADRIRGFYRLWVVKEAFLKAGGVGLSGELSKVEVSFPASIRWASPWAARELDLVEGYTAAVVAEGIELDVTLCGAEV